MAWNIIWNIFALFFAAPQDYPDHVGVVNDFANEIDATTKGKIEAVIADAQKKADVRIVVVVVTSLGGKAPGDYAVGLGNKWGVGQKGKNNGILFLHAPKERKIWIANGYGVESRLTDIESKMIIDQTIIPLMKEKKFAEAMLRGTEEIARVVSAPEKQEKRPEKQQAVPMAEKTDSGIGMGGITMVIILIAVFLVIFLIIISNSKPVYPMSVSTPRRYTPPDPPKRDDPLGIDPLMTAMMAGTILGSAVPPVQNSTPLPPLPPIPPAPEPSIADAFLAEQRRRDEEDRRRRRRREEEEEEERRRRRRRDDDSSYGGGSSSSSSSWSSSDSGSSSSFDGGSFGGGGAGGDY